MIEFYKLEFSPHKLFACDLMKCKKTAENSWSLRWCNKTIEVRNVWLQGLIEQTSGVNNEVLMIRDDTGTVKVLKCSSVPGDNSWLAKGIYCSVIGTLVKQSNLPEVAALKLTRLDENPVHATIWPYEVRDMKLLLTNQALPNK